MVDMPFGLLKLRLNRRHAISLPQNEDTELSRKLSEELFRIEQYVEMVLCYLRLGLGFNRLCDPFAGAG